MTEMTDTYNLNELKKFIRQCKGHKYEVFYKMIIAYKISRFELLNMKWSDINLEKNTITIYPVEHWKEDNIGQNYKYKRKMTRLENLKREFPLLPHIKTLLMELKASQLENSLSAENYDNSFSEYICLKENGERLNANTLSRNIKYVARDSGIKEVLLYGLKNSAEEFFIQKANSMDYFRCWTRYDIYKYQEKLYEKNYLLSKKHFVNELNKLVSLQNEKNIEM